MSKIVTYCPKGTYLLANGKIQLGNRPMGNAPSAVGTQEMADAIIEKVKSL